MNKNAKGTASSDLVLDDEIYARVYEEIENGIMDKASQARAVEECGTDRGAVKKIIH